MQEKENYFHKLKIILFYFIVKSTLIINKIMKFKYYTNCYKLSKNYPTTEDIWFDILTYQEKRELLDTSFTWRIYNSIYNETIISLESFKDKLQDTNFFQKISDKKYKIIYK